MAQYLAHTRCPVCKQLSLYACFLSTDLQLSCNGCGAVSTWPLATLMQSGKEPSQSLGDSDSQKLLSIFDQVTVLRSKFAGDFSDRSTFGQQLKSPFRDDKENANYAEADVCFAELQAALWRYFTVVKSAETGLKFLAPSKESSTSTHGKTP